MDQQEIRIIPLEMNIVISHKNNLPCLELRKSTTNTELIKNILSCAFHERPVIIQPKFRDKLKSISTLLDKGIVYLDRETQELLFNI